MQKCPMWQVAVSSTLKGQVIERDGKLDRTSGRKHNFQVAFHLQIGALVQMA